MSILSKWKDVMTDLGLEPTSVPTIKEAKPYYRKHLLSIHPDKCAGCSSERIAELSSKTVKFANDFNSFYKNPDQIEPVQNAFNDYLHNNTAKYFTNVDISVEDNELLLGELYYAFGLDSF
jgi:hypothetical protein